VTRSCWRMMLEPALDHEHLEVAARIGGVDEVVPVDRAVAAADVGVGRKRRGECVAVLGRNNVFDGDQHRSAIAGQRPGHDRHRPMQRGRRSRLSSPGRRQRNVPTLAAASPPADSSSAAGMPKRSATTPHSTLPNIRPPLKTIWVTARPRALTQAGSATCAATIRLDITASQAAPMISMIGTASASDCVTASGGRGGGDETAAEHKPVGRDAAADRGQHQRAGDGARADTAEQHAVDVRPAAELVARDQRQQRPIGAANRKNVPACTSVALSAGASRVNASRCGWRR
jgi:hypothetical protein